MMRQTMDRCAWQVAVAALALGLADAQGEPDATHGFNDVRLMNPEGSKHTTFVPEAYDRAAIERMLGNLAAHGFNGIRVFISSVADRPGAVFPNAADPELSASYMDNVADFLRRAGQHGIRVMPTFESLPLAERYLDLAGRGASELHHLNRMLLDPGHIRARQAFRKDSVQAIRARGP